MQTNDPVTKRLLSGKSGVGSWNRQHASRQSAKPLYTKEEWAKRRAERAAKQTKPN